MAGSVKVDKDLLVAKLEEKLGELRTAKFNHEIAHGKYVKAYASWEQKVIALLIKKGKVDNLHFVKWNNKASINYKYDIDIPEAPTVEDFLGEKSLTGYRIDSDIAEIEEFLKVMSITADSKIAMSVVNNLSRYL